MSKTTSSPAGKNCPVHVTRTRLPEFDDYARRLRDVFDSAWITNDGQCVRQLEQALADYLGCPHLLVCNNGTTALMLALHCAGLAGKKVAVTPYTYVATLSALLWLNCEPVFVDIDPQTLCLSPEKLETAFAQQPDIAGVLPVHIYGMACDVEAIAAICQRHNARLVYDAAQAFGSSYKGRSLLAYGDFSICSFHATKIFHTVEGGCVVAHSEDARKALSLARAFGHIGDTHHALGINGKLSEVHAAMGLCLLPDTANEIAARKALHARYDAALAELFETGALTRPQPLHGLDWNHAYYPVLLSDEDTLQRTQKALAAEDIHPRRYFYPALTTLPYAQQWRSPCPVAEDAALRVLCLPLHGGLERDVVERVAKACLTCW